VSLTDCIVMRVVFQKWRWRLLWLWSARHYFHLSSTFETPPYFPCCSCQAAGVRKHFFPPVSSFMCAGLPPALLRYISKGMGRGQQPSR